MLKVFPRAGLDILPVINQSLPALGRLCLLCRTAAQQTSGAVCRWQFLYNETLQQTFRPVLSKLSIRRRQI